MQATIEAEIRQYLATMSLEKQYQLLAFARSLATEHSQATNSSGKDKSGKALLRFVGRFDAESLKAMQQASETCRTIDSDGW